MPRPLSSAPGTTEDTTSTATALEQDPPREAPRQKGRRVTLPNKGRGSSQPTTPTPSSAAAAAAALAATLTAAERWGCLQLKDRIHPPPLLTPLLLPMGGEGKRKMCRARARRQERRWRETALQTALGQPRSLALGTARSAPLLRLGDGQTQPTRAAAPGSKIWLLRTQRGGPPGGAREGLRARRGMLQSRNVRRRRRRRRQALGDITASGTPRFPSACATSSAELSPVATSCPRAAHGAEQRGWAPQRRTKRLTKTFMKSSRSSPRAGLADRRHVLSMGSGLKMCCPASIPRRNLGVEGLRSGRALSRDPKALFEAPRRLGVHPAAL
mmetsp:Transcript_70813/g.160188  ORF Transcript_70813/g.160188 Transcript_70813/m.160188 type:complete len:328 (-) Transcript_70813:27-1010(-)